MLNEMEGNSVFGCLCCFGAFRWCCIGYETLAFHVRGRAQTETFKSGELKETFGLGGGGKNGTKWNCVITNFVICTFIKLVEMITLRRIFFWQRTFRCVVPKIIQGYWKWLLGSQTIHSICNPMWFLSMGLRQGSGLLCSSSSRKYPETEGTNQNRHSNHHRWHATDSLKRTRLSCWCL